MYIKTIIRFSFCDIQNNQGLGKGYGLYLVHFAPPSFLYARSCSLLNFLNQNESIVGSVIMADSAVSVTLGQKKRFCCCFCLLLLLLP